MFLAGAAAKAGQPNNRLKANSTHCTRNEHFLVLIACSGFSFVRGTREEHKKTNVGKRFKVGSPTLITRGLTRHVEDFRACDLVLKVLLGWLILASLIGMW